MNVNSFVLLVRIAVLVAAIIATLFGILMLFFYDRFQVFNEMVNTQYMVGKEKYKKQGGNSFDNLILGWHTPVAIFFLLVGVWLFYMFISYGSL